MSPIVITSDARELLFAHSARTFILQHSIGLTDIEFPPHSFWNPAKYGIPSPPSKVAFRVSAKTLPISRANVLESIGVAYMVEFVSACRRIACVLLFLSVGLSAQRYTGHDHAVFHRPPSPPPPTVKHQTPSAPSGNKNPQKVSPASPPSQLTSHAAPQNHPEVDLNQPSAPPKTGAPSENPPRL